MPAHSGSRIHMQTQYWGCRVQSPHDLWTLYHLDQPLANATGGEGGIYSLKPHAGERRVAKIYKSQAKALLNPDAFKSLALLTSKYAEYSSTLPFVAWPIEVLFTVKHPSSIQHIPTLAGITMRHITGHQVLEKLTSNGNGRLGLGTETAVRIAAVIAGQLARLHATGIVFCDLNPKNILVSNNRQTVTFVDADAFQHSIIADVFTKPHFFPGYASPDQANLKPGMRTPADDNFVLAIHIFQLLLDGGHPFDTGPAYNPTGDPFANITPNDNVKARRWPYSNIPLYRPPGETPKHYARLHPDLRAMFERAFLHFAPPAAAEWATLLPKFRNSVEASPPAPPQRPIPRKPLIPHRDPSQPPLTAHPSPKPKQALPKPFLPSPGQALSNLRAAAAQASRRFLIRNAFPIAVTSFGAVLLLAAYAATTPAPHRQTISAHPPPVPVPARANPITPPPPPKQALPSEPITRAAKATPIPPKPEILPWLETKPEILPWLAAPTPASPNKSDNPPKWTHKPRLSVDELNRLARSAQRKRKRRQSGWTRRGDRSEFRLVPGGTPIITIRPTY